MLVVKWNYQTAGVQLKITLKDSTVGARLTYKNHIVSARIATAPAGAPEPLFIVDASVT